MNISRSAGMLLLCGAMVAFVSGCKTPEPPAPPPVPVVVAPPPPPPVALSTQIIELASSYRAVMGAMGAITPNFTDGASVATAVRIGSSYQQDQLQQGAVAYAAIAALQEPSFVAAVRDSAHDRASRAALVQRILYGPHEASSLPNADRAAGLAIAALDGMGAKVTVAGKAVKQSAYDVQRQAWSKQNVADIAGRLDATKSLSAQRMAAGIDDVVALRQASLGAAAMSLAGEAINPPYNDTITRGLAIAALAALGAAGDENQASITPLLSTSDGTDFCLNMAKLNLYQCLAVAKPHYEDIFCLGQHAMIDTGQCISKAAASPNPAHVEPPALATVTYNPRPMSSLSPRRATPRAR